MPNATVDENYIAVLLAVSMIDLATPVRIAVNPITNAVICEIA